MSSGLTASYRLWVHLAQAAGLDGSPSREILGPSSKYPTVWDKLEYARDRTDDGTALLWAISVTALAEGRPLPNVYPAHTLSKIHASVVSVARGLDDVVYEAFEEVLGA